MMKRILSIDGGGMKGYIPCAILAQLESQTGKQCYEMFDMIAGTSIGGVIGSLLATGVPAADALKFFSECGPNMFKRRWWRYFGIFGPRYTADALEETLQEKLKGKEIKTYLLIPALDLMNQTSFFFKFNKHSKTDDLWKAARATSSAQIFFPAFKTRLDDGEHIFWDGGNVANNPALCAYVESIKLWPGKKSTDKTRVLSLGCGSTKSAIDLKRIVNANAFVNGSLTVQMLFEADGYETNYQMHKLIGDEYYRYQPTLKHKLSMDGASPEDLINLKNTANECIADEKLQQILKKFGR